mmetsp:Transcript_17169/g.47593  ORF Transcript_17169/g.47593 Transcript_17169/m.47593 type:complete len:129 (-) Transcript_17169:2484-2870(-)
MRNVPNCPVASNDTSKLDRISTCDAVAATFNSEAGKHSFPQLSHNITHKHMCTRALSISKAASMQYRKRPCNPCQWGSVLALRLLGGQACHFFYEVLQISPPQWGLHCLGHASDPGRVQLAVKRVPSH